MARLNRIARISALAGGAVAALLLAAAVVYAGGLEAVWYSLSGAELKDLESRSGESAGPAATSEKVVTAPAAPAASEEPTSTEPTVTAPAPAPEADEPPAVQPAATPPGGQQVARMYWEQVDSQQQINKLVNGEISSFSLGTPNVGAQVASVGVSVSYKAGGSLGGSLVMRKYGTAWYFSSITASGGGGTTAQRRPADQGVVSTLVSQQATNQNVILGFLDGGYKRVTVNSVSKGSGTATINVTLDGGTRPRSAAQIVAVSKNIDGTKYWFVTTFRLR